MSAIRLSEPSPRGREARSETPRYDDHSLATLVYNETSVILSTDGQGVMSTTLATEYARAYSMIESGSLTVESASRYAHPR